MKQSLLEYLACPKCRKGLRLSIKACDGPEVITGALSCVGCEREFAILRGVPRFVESTANLEEHRTAAAFGWQWRSFSEIGLHHEKQFLDWISPVSPTDFRDRVVLEGGCGKGRHSRLVGSYGSKAVLAVDLSDAVDVAFSNTRGQPNVHVIQANLLELPLRSRSCDHALSIGVLHHLKNPQAGFTELAAAVRGHGVVSTWVYGAEGNEWLTRIISPIRVAVTSRLPPRWLYSISWVLAIVLLPVLTIYRIARRDRLAWLRRVLFYYPYLAYISEFPLREIHAIVHDHLAAPIAHYLRREDLEGWYAAIGAREVRIVRHNGTSWRGWGIMQEHQEKDSSHATGPR